MSSQIVCRLIFCKLLRTSDTVINLTAFRVRLKNLPCYVKKSLLYPKIQIIRDRVEENTQRRHLKTKEIKLIFFGSFWMICRNNFECDASVLLGVTHIGAQLLIVKDHSFSSIVSTLLTTTMSKLFEPPY